MISRAPFSSQLGEIHCYAEFVLIMSGFLFQWPTRITLAMFPVWYWSTHSLQREKRAIQLPSSEVNTSDIAVVRRRFPTVPEHANRTVKSIAIGTI